MILYLFKSTMHNFFSLVEDKLWIGWDTEVGGENAVEDEKRALPGARVVVV